MKYQITEGEENRPGISSDLMSLHMEKVDW